ncbi:D-aspartate oxidase [Vanessa tameamea]|uniref:D-aspartate oxidase n=1 Tax=Vanessa tameamea TaxID=334116 RepID=A0A8B8IQV0_VANTA
MTKVAVLGAGINGLSCAVKIKEKYPYIDVVIIANDFTPNTTGDGSGGLWYPYLCGSTSPQLLSKWGGETYKYLHKLWLKGGYDVSLMPMLELYRHKRELPIDEWASSVFGYRILDQHQLDYLSGLYSVKYVAGRTFTTLVVYPPTILAEMYRRFKQVNGFVIQSNINSLRDTKLSDYNVVINCMGLGSRDAVPDYKVIPIRGQISRIEAPWINNTVVDEDTGNYIIPNVYNCVLGGTHQENNYNRDINDNDTDFILNGCMELMPGIQHAKPITHWVGLRPGREKIRLESEEKDGKFYIHNYGHGGSGLTLFWGCASDVLEIFDNYMNIIKQKEKSKL